MIADIAARRFAFTKTGAILQRIAKSVHGMKRIARFVAVPCEYTAIGTTHRRFTRNAENEKQRNGLSGLVGIADAPCGFTAIGTTSPNITRSVRSTKRVVTFAGAPCESIELGTIPPKLTRSVSLPKKLSGLRSHASSVGVQYESTVIGMISLITTRSVLGMRRTVIFAGVPCVFTEHGQTHPALTKSVSSDSHPKTFHALSAARASSFPQAYNLSAKRMDGICRTAAKSANTMRY